VERLPTTYSGLTVTVHISKSAKDNIDEMLGAVADISNRTPSLAVSKSALGTVSAGKTLLDYLFSKQLLEPKLVSTLRFPSDGNSLPAGYYVAFAADTGNQYQKYVDAAIAGQLTWDSVQLRSKGDPIRDVSYFLMSVSYSEKIFLGAAAALGFNKPWAALYKEGRRKIDEITESSQANKIADEIRADLRNARRLLDADPDLIQAERDSIHATISSEATKALNTRIAALDQAKRDGGIFIMAPPTRFEFK
jgi:hypothetical protein